MTVPSVAPGAEPGAAVVPLAVEGAPVDGPLIAPEAESGFEFGIEPP